MYGIDLGWGPTVFWCVITPVFTLALFLHSAWSHKELVYERSSQIEPYEYPTWALQLGWVMSCFGLVCIPIGMIYHVCNAPRSFVQRLKFSLEPQLPESIRERLDDGIVTSRDVLTEKETYD